MESHRYNFKLCILIVLILFCLFVGETECVTMERCEKCCEAMNEDFDGGLVNGKRPPGDLFHYKFCISRGCNAPEIDCVEGYENIHPRYNDIRGCRAGQSFLADKEVGFNPPAFLNITGSIIYKCTDDNFTITEDDKPYIDPENPNDPYNKPEGENALPTPSPTDDPSNEEGESEGGESDGDEFEGGESEGDESEGGESEGLPKTTGIADSSMSAGIKIVIGIASGAAILGVIVKAVFINHERTMNRLPSYLITPEQARHEVTPTTHNMASA
mmetsp:Transcript_10277/g.12836  ORF Transcript_10277/g.12836 Transcript_10277/m.12836 type:complete len:272 (-) Transcript_10277:467-1282(-)